MASFWAFFGKSGQLIISTYGHTDGLTICCGIKKFEIMKRRTAFETF